MAFVVHDTGSYCRHTAFEAAQRAVPTIHEHDSLSDMDEPDRQQFQWMLDNNIPLTQIGARTFQIRFMD